MKMKQTEKHKLNTADIITLFRIAGTAGLAFLKPFSTAFLCLYSITGLTDIADGMLARRTATASDFGARLDSIADLLFYAVTLFRVFPSLWSTLPKSIWFAVAAVITLRISAYITAALKYRRFASLHTYLNKLTGLAVFFIPFLLVTRYSVGYCIAVSAIAALASLEELIIHLISREYNANAKSVFPKKSLLRDSINT